MRQNQRIISLITLIVVHTALCTGVKSIFAAPPATASSQQEPPHGPSVDLFTFLDQHNTRLSTDDRSLSDRFHFTLQVAGTRPDGNVEHMFIDVDRDRGHAIIIFRSADGLPYCYMTEGLFVIFDKDHPGAVAVREGGHPEFALAGDEDTARLIFNMTYYKTVGHTRITLDIRSVIAAGVKKAASVIARPDHNGFDIATATSTISIDASPIAKKTFFGVQRLAIRRPPHLELILSAFGEEPDVSKEAFVLTRGTIEKAGITIRSLGSAEDIPLDSLAVPINFAHEPAEHDSAVKFGAVLGERLPTTTQSDQTFHGANESP